MKRSFVAFGIALLITACVGAAIFAIGGAALVNRNGVAASDSPAQASELAASVQSNDVGQLRALVSQYQAREQDLQQQLAQANTQLQQDQQLLQQVRLLLGALQQRGLIRLTNDGQVIISQ